MSKSPGGGAEHALGVIRTFLKSCRQPALLEPGEEILPLAADNFTLELNGERLTIQAWDRTRNLSRRVTSAGEPSPGPARARRRNTAAGRGQFHAGAERRAP